MRLLNSTTFEFKEFSDNRVPKYAILSHTWGEDEVTFADLVDGCHAHQSDFDKIRQTCIQAAKDGYDYVWIDTCCIDKKSSAELSEAINAMYSWYSKAAICYAYLSDVPAEADVHSRNSDFTKSRWFTRGWTLQELVAPVDLRFFAQDWTELGSKITLQETLASVTGIERGVLAGTIEIKTRSIAQRMSWASRRETTRTEDIAYCLLGIFDVNMPLLYGEGGVKAFIRLEEEIIRQSDDQTLFAWTNSNAHVDDLCGLLADSPAYFKNSDQLVPYRDWGLREPYSISNKGLRIRLRLDSYKDHADVYIAELECQADCHSNRRLGILLKRISTGSPSFARISPNKFFETFGGGCEETIYVRQSVITPGPDDIYPVHEMTIGRLPARTWIYKLMGTYGRRGTLLEDLKSQKIQRSKYTQVMRGFHWERDCGPSSRKKVHISKSGPEFAFATVFERHDGKILAILLGSMQDFDVGFDAVSIPDGNFHAYFRSLYHGGTTFKPRPMGTVRALHDHRICVRADPQIVENVKHFVADIEIEAIYHKPKDQHSERKGFQKFKHHFKQQSSEK